jgi:type IV fimbrial biogenesis protein FimT
MLAWMRCRGRSTGARLTLGVTLLELCFALGLLALLAGLAAPGFRTGLRTAAVRAATFELLTGLQQTRANSILESRPGTLCPTAAAGTCLPPSVPGTAWQAVPGDAPGGASPGHRLLPRGVVVRASRSPIRFWPHASAASTGTLTICDTQGVASPRAIIVSQTGRARLTAAPAGACGS